MKALAAAAAFSFVLTSGAASASLVVPQKVERRTCLVSNERTGAGTSSLQSAVAEAVAGDTLVVKGSCGGAHIGIDLAIKGVTNKPFGTATIGSFGIGTLGGPSVSVTVSELLIVGGISVGMYADGPSVTVKNSTITGGSVGVSISPATHGSATLIDSEITGQTDAGVVIGRSGAVTLVRSSVHHNGGRGIIGGRYGSVSLTDSDVSFNGGGGISAGSFAGSGTVTLTRSSVTDNNGSGISLYEAGATLLDSHVLRNVTVGNGGGITGQYASVALVDSTVGSNSAAGDGGGVFMGAVGLVSLVRSAVTGNSAGGTGGGLNVTGSLSLTDSAVTGNTATAAGGIFYSPSGDWTATLSGSNSIINNAPDNCVGLTGC